MTNVIRRHWTRHSLVLSVAGLIYVGIGVAFILSPGYVGKDPSLKVALQWLSLTGWGVVYIVCGSLGMLAGFAPVGKKTFGYMILTGLSSLWAGFYVMSVIFGEAPKLTLLSGLIWILLAFIWWAVSGLISPEHLKAMMSNDRD